jgi:hypothetical protein
MPSSGEPPRDATPPPRQPPTAISYHLPRKKVDPPRAVDFIALLASIVVGIGLIIAGIFVLFSAIQNGGSLDFRAGIGSVSLGVLAIGLGFGSWRNARLRRHSKANVPRFCDGCGTALTGLAVSRCPECGHAHPDSAEAAAARLGQFTQNIPEETHGES